MSDRAMKVWGTHRYFIGAAQVRAIVAARTQKEAADCFGTSLYCLRLYASETGNETEIKTALSKPGAVFYTALNQAIYSEVK